MGLFTWLFGSSNRDGSSAEKAIIVRDVAEEYAWMSRHCSGFHHVMQALQFIAEKPYDVHTLRSDSGTERTVYFDISSFFGKF